MQIFSKSFIFILALICGSRNFKLLAQMLVADIDHANKKVICHNGAVVSANRLASMAGIQMLKLGGNAVDAAIATQLALAVVYPGAGNIGGGGFMVARLANGNNITIDFREKAPAAASR